MWMRVKMIVLFVCLLLLLSTVGSARDLVLTISPEMELLAGVLSQTTWIERRGPEGSGNEYYRALYEFFTPIGTTRQLSWPKGSPIGALPTMLRLPSLCI